MEIKLVEVGGYCKKIVWKWVFRLGTASDVQTYACRCIIRHICKSLAESYIFKKNPYLIHFPFNIRLDEFFITKSVGFISPIFITNLAHFSLVLFWTTKYEFFSFKCFKQCSVFRYETKSVRIEGFWLLIFGFFGERKLLEVNYQFWIID